jgi:hypothetical protein
MKRRTEAAVFMVRQRERQLPSYAKHPTDPR